MRIRYHRVEIEDCHLPRCFASSDLLIWQQACISMKQISKLAHQTRLQNSVMAHPLLSQEVPQRVSVGAEFVRISAFRI